jgi:hypothetical protein
MNDEFNIEVHNYKENENKLREAIIKSLKYPVNVDMNNSYNFINENQVINRLINDMNTSINKLENLNFISLYNKIRCVDEITRRACIIGDIKENYKKLNNFLIARLDGNNIIVYFFKNHIGKKIKWC